MAVAYRSATSASDLSPAEPAGAAEFDIILAVYSNESVGATLTPATGFAQINYDTDHGAGSGAGQHWSGWIRRGGSAIANNWADGGAGGRVCLICYSGCKTSGSPINTSSYAEANSASINHATITTTVDGCMIVGLSNVWSWGSGTSTDFANERIDQGEAIYIYDDGLLVAAGATGTMLVTTTGGVWGATLLGLEPADAAGPPGLVTDPSMLAGFFIRNQRQLSLWEGSPGATAPVVTGVADASFGGDFTAAGAPNTLGVAVATFGFTATAVGHIVERGVAVASFGGTFTALGIDRALGVATAAFGGTFTALGVVGTPPVQGQATATFGGTFTASGAPRTPGAATATYGGTFTASGVDRALGQAVASFGFTATALGVDRALGQATASFGFTATALGIPRTPGVAVATFGFTATALGFAGTPPVQGQATATFGGTLTALGVDRALGVATAAFGFTATSSGHQHRTGTATATFGYTATAAGLPRVQGQATASFGFVAAIYLITYKMRVVAVGTNRYTATGGTSSRYSGAAGGNRYSAEED